MHELSLVSALVEQVEELSRVQHFDRVLTIWVSVGALSGADHPASTFVLPRPREAPFLGALDSSCDEWRLSWRAARARRCPPPPTHGLCSVGAATRRTCRSVRAKTFASLNWRSSDVPRLRL